MKHRHRLQQQRHKAASPGRRSEANEAADEQPQPSSSKAKRRVQLEMRAEGNRPKRRLDKFRRGGRQRSKKYDLGGAAAPGGGVSNTPGVSDFISTPHVNPVTAFVQRAIPPIARNISLNPKWPSPPPLGKGLANAMGNKAGGRIGRRKFDDGGGVSGGSSTRSPDDPGGEIAAANKGRKSTGEWIRDEIFTGGRPAYKHGGRQRPKKFDDGGTIGDASPIPAPNLALGSGPPPPPRVSNDGTPIPAAPPRANDPGFVNRLNASQKNAQLKQRIKQLEGKSR